MPHAPQPHAVVLYSIADTGKIINVSVAHDYAHALATLQAIYADAWEAAGGKQSLAADDPTNVAVGPFPMHATEVDIGAWFMQQHDTRVVEIVPVNTLSGQQYAGSPIPPYGYTRPPHLAVAPLSPLADAMLMLIGSFTMSARSTNGCMPSWSLTRALPAAADLDVVASRDTPGNAAMHELMHAGLVEEVPDLGSRYRLTTLGCAVVLVHP